MKMKVSDYIANYIAESGITNVFTVVGGGAMHLNNSFGHHPKLKCVYNHHEQASSMAAEAYYRVNNNMACVCVTSGPGAINALNGVAGAYQDSIPMLVVSGQCKSALTVRRNNIELRTLGPQEFDIVSALDNFTKYAEVLTDAADVKYCLEKAIYTAKSGRPGPCWIEVPVDIQGMIIDTEELRTYDAEEIYLDTEEVVSEKIDILLDKLTKAKRPVIYAGNGIRIANAFEKFREMVKSIEIPVVTCWDSIDLMKTDDEYYVGRGGTMGDRAGNFAVQNSDFLLVLGSRLNTYQVGYNLDTWAQDAYVVVVDIDRNELKKPTIRVDLGICEDVKVIISELLRKKEKFVKHNFVSWKNQCNKWKIKYPVVNDKQRQQSGLVNIYAFIDYLSRKLPENMITVVANGSASVVGSQAYYIGSGNRFIMNCGISSMGYDLPAAIGVCIANDGKDVLCIAGDGSIQMNLQELQTIVTNKLPIKIVVINNNGYQQIRITQTNLFNAEFIGIGPDSGDLGFPDFEKLAYAYGIPYKRCDNKNKISETVEWLYKEKSYCMLEVLCDTEQFFEPKSATKRNEDGTLCSPPLEDMAPFLSKKELQENMYLSAYNN